MSKELLNYTRTGSYPGLSSIKGTGRGTGRVGAAS